MHSSFALFERRSQFPVAADALFAYHARTGAFERLIPPWERVSLVYQDPGLEAGNRTVIRMQAGIIPVTWVAEHTEYTPGKSFTDMQVSGPFAYWKHQHIVVPLGENRAELLDRIYFRLPLGTIGQYLGVNAVKRKLASTFRFRHWITGRDIAVLQKLKGGSFSVKIRGGPENQCQRVSSFLKLAGHRLVEAADEDFEIVLSGDTVMVTDKRNGKTGVFHLGIVLDPCKGVLKRTLMASRFRIRIPLKESMRRQGWVLADDVAYSLAFLLECAEMPAEGVIRCGTFAHPYALADAVFQIYGKNPLWTMPGGKEPQKMEREASLPDGHYAGGGCVLNDLLAPLLS